MGILQDLQEDNADLEMTPMIDVTFLLLIFFMCTLKFKTLEGKLNAFLPKDVGVNTAPAEEKEKSKSSSESAIRGTRSPPMAGSGTARVATSSTTRARSSTRSAR